MRTVERLYEDRDKVLARMVRVLAGQRGHESQEVLDEEGLDALRVEAEGYLAENDPEFTGEQIEVRSPFDGLMIEWFELDDQIREIEDDGDWGRFTQT